MTIINLATEDTSEIENEIESRIDILNTLIEKIDSLTNELVLNMGVSKSKEDSDVKNILDEMEDLIDSVKDY